MRRRTEHVADARRREAVYRRWCAEILRETRDRPSLTRAEGRALNASDVRVDPELARMIHGFALEQEAMLTQMEMRCAVFGLMRSDPGRGVSRWGDLRVAD